MSGLDLLAMAAVAMVAYVIGWSRGYDEGWEIGSDSMANRWKLSDIRRGD